MRGMKGNEAEGSEGREGTRWGGKGVQLERKEEAKEKIQDSGIQERKQVKEGEIGDGGD